MVTNKMKRIFCILLASLLLFMAPVRSYSMGTAAVTVGAYAIQHVLAACGILLGAGATAVLIGTWEDRNAYFQAGAAKQLGSYAQNVYDGARDTASGSMEKYQAIEETLIALVSSKWGEAVSGIRLLADDLKTYCKLIYGYGRAGEYWHVPSVPVDKVWNKTQWSTRDFFPLPTSPAVLVPPVANDPSYTLFLSSYCISPYATAMNIQNWYYENSLDIFGVYDAANMILTTYQRDAANGKYALYYGTAYSAFINEDGTLKYDVSSTSYWQRETILCIPEDAGALPFPVFGSLADAEAYVVTGEAVNTYVAGTVPMQVEAFREDVAALDVGAISDVLTLPQTGEAAAENMATLESVYAGAVATDLEQVLADNGIAVNVTDVPVEGDVSIIDSIKAIPGQIADVITGALTVDQAEAEEKLSIPAMVKDKFPFCIPFDFIHLVQALAAEREVPRFEIPLEFHYHNFHYSEVFVVDMAVFDPAITIFRVMQDLLFCAGLVVATRNLIRG